MVERLRDLGIDITLDEVETESGGGTTGRPHIASLLIQKGVVPTMEAAFDEYLAAGRPGYVGRERLSPEDALSLARRSGAVPVLAHPHTLGLDTRFGMHDLLERLHAAGLVGLECLYGSYDREGRAGLVSLARRFGLVPSGGSDYHGSYKPDVSLGMGRVGLPVPDTILPALSAARSSITT
jgi:predicted metal-dependent phosphoesterase TrpH